MENKVTDAECKEAIEYFWTLGMIDNGMKEDERYYCKILLKRVANTLNVTLNDGEGDE